VKFIHAGNLPADPTETRSAHCKVYLEPSIKAAIEHFQIINRLDSFSEAARQVILHGFNYQAEHYRSKQFEEFINESRKG
jgi:hypothetical protein